MIKGSFPSTLSDDQISAVNRIESFLSSSNNCFLLKGYAGTGKTFLMQGLVKYFQSARRQFVLMAPTGRAAMIIGDKTNAEAYTIHKSIYNLNELEDDDHTFKFRYALNQNIASTNAVYIVDESSMISDVYNEDEFFVFGSGYLLKDLFQYVDFNYRFNSKVIFIGDNAQLPPVGMNFSPALDREYLSKQYKVAVDEFEMKQIQRQQEGSGILKLATNLRNSLERNEFNQFEIEESANVTKTTGIDFKNAYRTLAKDEVVRTIVITHANRQAHDYNSIIRRDILGRKPTVQTGDVLINTKNNYNYPVDFYNGQFLSVVDASESTELKTIRFIKKGGDKAEVKFVFRDIVTELVDVKGQKHLVRCKLIDSFLNSEQPRLTQNEQQALYVDFKNRHPTLKPRTKEFKDAIRADLYFNAMQVKYGYAITCHKSQGGEWDNVFLDLQVYMRVLSRGFFRWAYTGITRARTTLITLNAKQYSPLSEYIVQPTTAVNSVPANQYYIPTDFFDRSIALEFARPFLKAKYVELIEKFKDQDVVVSVSHLQYVERYSFSRGQETATVDLNYGNAGFSGTMRTISSSSKEFNDYLLNRIREPLMFEVPYSPPSEHQKMLFNLLSEEAKEEGITITNISNDNYCDRYFLKTDAAGAYLDCFYNGQGIYSTFRPYSTSGLQDLKLQALINRLS